MILYLPRPLLVLSSTGTTKFFIVQPRPTVVGVITNDGQPNS